MLQIQFSHDYLTAQELMLLENSFMEEVIAEIRNNEYLFTCSLGRCQNQAYITWNLFYYNQLVDIKSVNINKQLNIFDKNELQQEMIYKFRQMLLKYVNRSGDLLYNVSKVLEYTSPIEIQNI